ncbi:MAG: hypothetical protein OEU54_13170, partial [Gemmatimonadota bacterium]|nr:hypothetical protein [Gemmatimonadota bacterium]
MKNIINEIHRRSLWQVLGVYLAVSWIVLQVIDVLANNIGLPAWVAPTALALLLVGLPVVVATAFVQEGLGNRAKGPVTAESDPVSGAGAEGVEAEAAGAAALKVTGSQHRLFTWRNALVGGVAAFAVLGVLTAGYLFMRTSGIGPAATLVAQGVLEEGTDVVLAEFDSADADLA